METSFGFFITARQQIQDLRSVAQKYPSGNELSDQDGRFVFGNLWEFGRTCQRLEFKTALVPIGYAIRVFDFAQPFNGQNVKHLEKRAGQLLLRLDQLEENFYRDAMLRFALAIPEDRLDYFSGGLSRRFKSTFPSAMEDIDEAGKCYATGRHRATVFHVIRACEWALKGLAKAAGVPGKLDYKEWGKIIKGIEEKVSAIDKWATGPEKSNALAFYRNVLADARSLNNVWRTTNLHVRPGVKCDETDAKKALDRGLDFLTTVATRVSETQKRPLTKRSFRK